MLKANNDVCDYIWRSSKFDGELIRTTVQFIRLHCRKKWLTFSTGMTDNSTLEYYNSHASDYANITKQADMSENYSRFLKHVKTGGSIADIGCGSGRDLKYFRDNGYESYDVDASAELCRIASEYSGCPVTCSDFLSWTPNIQFDAFWTNASLLHLTEEEIIRFFITKTGFIQSGGVLYFSMKTGIKEGFDGN